MPNWCQNNITINGDSDSDIKKIIDFFESNKRDERVMSSLIHDSDYDIDKLDKLIHQSGFSDFTFIYGTKWDFNIEEAEFFTFGDNSICMIPNTAWTPPLGFCSLLSKKYKVNVEIIFYESGCDFSGKYVFNNGIVISRMDVDYSHGLYLWDTDYFFERFEEDYHEQYLEAAENNGGNKYFFKTFLEDNYPYFSLEEKEEYNNKFYKRNNKS